MKYYKSKSMIITYLNYCYKLVYEIIDLCIILLSIIALIVSLLGYSKINTLNDRLISTFDHGWDRNFIMEIYEGQGSCEQGSDFLIQDDWSGTVEGCDCRGLVNDYIPWNKQNKTSQEGCSVNMTLGGCKNVPQIGRIPYTKWRQVYLCARRIGMPYLKHLSRYLNQATSSCPNETKQCGILDTTGNKLCVDLKDNCPLNTIILTSEAPPNEYMFKSIMISNSMYLHYTNEAVNSSVYLDIKISEGEPCLDPLEKNARKQPYTLERDNEVFCRTSLNETRYDSRYAIIATETKGELYKDNGITQLLSSLPGYLFDDLMGEVGLYSRPFIGWKRQCIDDENLSPEKMKTLPELVAVIKLRKMICMIISVVLVIYCISTIFVKFKYSDNPLIFNLIEIGFVIISLFVFMYAYSNYKRINFFSMLDDFNCSDELTNAIFQDFGRNVLSQLGYELSLSIISLICFSIYPLIFIINLIFFIHEKMREHEQPDYYSYA